MLTIRAIQAGCSFLQQWRTDILKAVCIVGSPRAEGSTATIAAEIVGALVEHGYQAQTILIGDADIAYCFGCRACEKTGECVQTDDVQQIVESMLYADMVIMASPSYWGDITGQLKVFIDRCTSYGNANPARKAMQTSAKGVAIAVRAGKSIGESMRLVATMEHFLSHLDIPLVRYFTAEGIGSKADLCKGDTLARAHAFGEMLAMEQTNAN